MATNLELERLAQVLTERVQQNLLEQGLPHAVDGLHPTTELDTALRGPEGRIGPAETAAFIDHTLLRPDATRDDLRRLCDEARDHDFWSVCVNSSMVGLACDYLADTPVAICAVVGFPLGAATPGAKAYEAVEAAQSGAEEIDMVINVGALKSKDYGLVLRDIQRVVEAVPDCIVKVILETGLLSDQEKVVACSLAKAAGAHFVKTSTGFGHGGATVEDVQLMRSVVGPEMGVKASGGIRDHKTALAMFKAGATRLGCSSSVAVVTGSKGQGTY